MARTLANPITPKPASASIQDCISRTSAISISSKPECTPKEQYFKDCISVDVDAAFYRQMPPLFFESPNTRLKGILNNAAVYAKDNGAQRLHTLLKAKEDSDCESDSNASSSSDDT